MGFNEFKCQWVGEKLWIYRILFFVVKSLKKGIKYVLVFDGLDIFVIVKVNGKVVLESDNMFIEYCIDVI